MRLAAIPFFIAPAISVLMLAGCARLPFEESVDPGASWSLVIESLSNPDNVLTFTQEDAQLLASRKEGGSRVFRFGDICGKDIEVSIRYARSAEDGALDVSAEIRNGTEDWVVSEFFGPEIKGLGIRNPEEYSLIRSTRKGLRTDMRALKAVAGKKKDADGWSWKKEGYYEIPPYGPMKFCILAGKEDGLYLGIDNDKYEKIGGIFRYYPDSDQIGIMNRSFFFCHPGETYTTPSTHLWAYKGDWHVAADRYRKWFLAHHEIAPHPEWVRHTTGWMLTILKQQNAEIIWPYAAIGREMSDEAEKNGFNLLGLFGRAIGGHDRFYPDYTPDPDMGGEEAFRKGLEEMHARGLRAIVYTNGQLLDRNGLDDWWETTGKSLSLVNKKGEVYGESFQKFHDGPNRQFTWACMRTSQWQDMLMDFAMDAARLGADGIIFDQLGGPSYRRCYSKDHGHKVPDFAYGPDLMQTLEHISREVRKTYPDFVFMTEGYCDYELPSVTISHRGMSGRSYATATQKNMEDMALHRGVSYPFPQFVTYTFPEALGTTNNPAPTNRRIYINYAAMFNDRPEIEVRYTPDKRFLETGINRTKEEYKNIKGPTSGSGPFHEDAVMHDDLHTLRLYSKQVLDMLRAHSDVMYDGIFVDDRGFTLDSGSPLVYAKAYENGNKRAVLVWNISDKEAAAYTVTPDAGWTQVEITSPEGPVAPGSPLAPQSLHLLVFKK